MKVVGLTVRPDPLDVLRALLTILIVWHHCNPPAVVFGIPLSVPGRVSVWLFYVLSGYVIGLGYASGRYDLSASSIRQFYINRLIRIIPLLYFSYIAVYLLAYRDGSLWQCSSIRDLLFLRYQFTFKYVTAAWFLGPLMQLYVLAPFLIWCIQRCELDRLSKRSYFMLCALTLIGHHVGVVMNICFLKDVGMSLLDNRSFFGALGLFVAGLSLSHWLANNSSLVVQRLGLSSFFARATVIALLVVCAVYYSSPRAFYSLPSVLIVMAGGMCLITWLWQLSQGEEFEKMAIQNLILKFLFLTSALSYGIFLWHDLFINFWEQSGLLGQASRDLSFILKFILVFGCSMIVAFFLYIGVDLQISRFRSVIRK